MPDFIPQMEPWFDDREATALAGYIRSGGWVTEFKKTQEFERLIREFTGAKFCFAVNSGTIALSVALLALGVGSGDGVIVPDLTMIATPNAARLIGARPVFVDVEPHSLCMDPDKLAPAVTSKTRAVIVVSLNGRAESLDAIVDFCKEKRIFLLEDAAQSLGSWHKGRHLGLVGDIGIFSFSSQKIISTGQGGAVVTNNAGLAEKIKKIKDFGRESGGNDIHDSLGYNFKFTDIQAVVGIEQMRKLPERVSRKKEIYARYVERFKESPRIELIDTDLSETTPWFVDIYVDEPDALTEHLRKNSIGARRIYPPIHSQKAYAITAFFPVTERYAARGVWLPSSTKLRDDQIDRICDTVLDYLEDRQC